MHWKKKRISYLSRFGKCVLKYVDNYIHAKFEFKKTKHFKIFYIELVRHSQLFTKKHRNLRNCHSIFRVASYRIIQYNKLESTNKPQKMEIN